MSQLQQPARRERPVREAVGSVAKTVGSLANSTYLLSELIALGIGDELIEQRMEGYQTFRETIVQSKMSAGVIRAMFRNTPRAEDAEAIIMDLRLK